MCVSTNLTNFNAKSINTTMVLISIRLCLDVHIMRFGIALPSMPISQDIDIDIECQYFCLDV